MQDAQTSLAKVSKMTQELIEKFLDKKNIFAVVGVSTNPEKYGHKVYLDLRSAGYKVYPVNPGVEKVLGDKCYPALSKLPEKPDVVNVVVPQEITEKVVRECKELDIRMVWMQPGSESMKAIGFCIDNGIDVLHDVCVMVERKKL